MTKPIRKHVIYMAPYVLVHLNLMGPIRYFFNSIYFYKEIHFGRKMYA